MHLDLPIYVKSRARVPDLSGNHTIKNKKRKRELGRERRRESRTRGEAGRRTTGGRGRGGKMNNESDSMDSFIETKLESNNSFSSHLDLIMVLK